MKNHLFDGLFAQVDSERVLAHLEDGRIYRYQDALNVSAQLANVLRSRGVQKGDRVAVQVPKSIEAVMLYLACVRVGAIFLPLNTAYTETEVCYFLDDAEPALLVCDPASLALYESVAAQRKITIDSLGVSTATGGSAGTLSDAGLKASTEFDNAQLDSDDLAAILYTSGTTGRSKGAMLSHANLLSNAKSLQQAWQFSKDDVLIHALPIFHTHGLFVAINVLLLAGASMHYLHSFSVDKVLAALPKSTTLMGVPTFYTRLLESAQFTQKSAAHMRLFISGSAPLLADTHSEFEQRTGHRILERYGMTETNMNTSNPYDAERRPGTVGFALPEVEVRITDADTSQPVEQGETGLIEVRGPNVFQGYWRMPEKTKEELRENGFFITGDLGLFDADGYLHIVGRSKDLIISGGFNIYPKEIELLLDDVPGVLESAVIGVPHPDFGEGVVGVLVAANADQVPEADVLDAIKNKLARFKLPKKIHYVDELPRNTMGKVQKNKLRESFANLFS